MTTRATRTYALLAVSPAAYEEIRNPQHQDETRER